MKGEWGNLNKCILPSERSEYEKAIYENMIPSILVWHSGKGKARDTVRRSVVSRGWRLSRDEQAEDRGLSGQWKCSVR